MTLAKMDRNLLQFAITLYVPGFFINLGFSIVSPIERATTQLFVKETLKAKESS